MNSKAARQITMLETVLANDADVMRPEQVESLKRQIASLKGIVEFEQANEVARVERIAATDAIIAEDVETGNTEVGNLAARVEAKVAASKVEAVNAKRVAAGRPKMTAEQARKFEMYSEKNAGIVEESCENGCIAYEDWFTFNRWIAQGFVVRKGEKSTKVLVPIFREVRDETTDTVRKVKVGERPVPVFCRCQVKRLEAKKGRAA